MGRWPHPGVNRTARNKVSQGANRCVSSERSVVADDVNEPESGSLDPNQAGGDVTNGEEVGPCSGTDEGDSGTAAPEDATTSTAAPKRTHEADSVLGDTEEEDGRRKKRKEVDGKARSLGSASTSKSSKVGANVGGTSSQQGCISGTGGNSVITPDEESERSPKVPPLKIVIPAANSADPEPGSARGKVGMPRQALPYVVAAQEGSSGGSTEEASAGDQSQLSLLSEQTGASGGTSEEGLRPQRVLRSSNKSSSNAPSPAPGSSSPHQVQRQSPLPTTTTEISEMCASPATTVASQTSTLTTEGGKTTMSSSVTTAAGIASERTDSASNATSSQAPQESQHQEQSTKEQKQPSLQSPQQQQPPPEQQQQSVQQQKQQQSFQQQKQQQEQQEQEKDQEPHQTTQSTPQQQQHQDQQQGPPPPPAPPSVSAPAPQQQQTQQSQAQHETSSNSQHSTAQPMTFHASVELHPRKRKMKQSRDGVVGSSGSAVVSATVSSTGGSGVGQSGNATTGPGAQVSSAGSDASDSGGTVPDVHPHDQPITNCYQLFLNIRKQIERRRKGLFPVQPKPPQGFKDYLMNRCTYLLAGNASSRMSVPAATPPQNLHPAMKDLFVEQEKERHRLRMQHVIEKEKLVLSVEQEILRVHGRAARALANQSLPYSVCTILKDEEVYNVITPEQEEKDRNARSRYNGRLFLSWLQDVDDKWEKIKEAMLQRHRIEAGSLHAVQRMDWEWKMKELSLCEFKARPTIDETQVPMVLVNDDFDLLPA